MRDLRLSTIRTLVDSTRIEHQDQILTHLRERGMEVTQATLSRDLKALNIARLPDGEGGYVYGYVDGEGKAGSDRNLVHDFMRGFICIEFSGGLGVIRTLPGHAGSVAYALDHLGLDTVLGTIAGDDTVLVIPRDRVGRARIVRELGQRIPGIKESTS